MIKTISFQLTFQVLVDSFMDRTDRSGNLIHYYYFFYYTIYLRILKLEFTFVYDGLNYTMIK
jgi:hypothetical protein